MTRALKTVDGRFWLVLDRKPIDVINGLCRLAEGRETGGILVGSYSADHLTAYVQEAVRPPKDSRSGHTWFVRGVTGLRKLLKERWDSSSPTYYLGEWHFHPALAIDPSADDFQQMDAISTNPRYQCVSPLLLIFGKSGDYGTAADLPFRAFVCPSGEVPVELFPVLLPDNPGV